MEFLESSGAGSSRILAVTRSAQDQRHETNADKLAESVRYGAFAASCCPTPRAYRLDAFGADFFLICCGLDASGDFDTACLCHYSKCIVSTDPRPLGMTIDRYSVATSFAGGAARSRRTLHGSNEKLGQSMNSYNGDDAGDEDDKVGRCRRTNGETAPGRHLSRYAVSIFPNHHRSGHAVLRSMVKPIVPSWLAEAQLP